VLSLRTLAGQDEKGARLNFLGKEKGARLNFSSLVAVVSARSLPKN
jgi:hypothetical protein